MAKALLFHFFCVFNRKRAFAFNYKSHGPNSKELSSVALLTRIRKGRRVNVYIIPTIYIEHTYIYLPKPIREINNIMPAVLVGGTGRRPLIVKNSNAGQLAFATWQFKTFAQTHMYEIIFTHNKHKSSKHTYTLAHIHIYIYLCAPMISPTKWAFNGTIS